MRLSRKNSIFRALATMAVAAPLLVGCNESSPTEPKLAAGPTPATTPAPTYTGTYNGVSPQCDSSAQASFLHRDARGGGWSGTMIVPCLNAPYPLPFTGDFAGNTFTGSVLTSSDLDFKFLQGTLSGSSLEITILNETTLTPMGQLHLHQ